MTISNRNMDRVSLVCHATVAHTFAMFCNPIYRGNKFQWDKFPNMMKNKCREQVYMANIKGRDQNAVYEHAEQTGFDIATKMIEEAGFETRK
jgi:hypothetical protein